MIKRQLRTTLGNYDIELLQSGEDLCVATISKSNGDYYLHWHQVPKLIRNYIKANYKVALYDVNTLNRMLGLVI